MNKCSILREIKRAEDSIDSCYKKANELEMKLKTHDLPIEQKRLLENELTEVRKLLATNEEHLSQLHGHNRRSFAVAAALAFALFLFYGVYILCTGGNL